MPSQKRCGESKWDSASRPEWHQVLHLWSLWPHIQKLSKELPNWFRRSPWEANAKSTKPEPIGDSRGSCGEGTRPACETRRKQATELQHPKTREWTGEHTWPSSRSHAWTFIHQQSPRFTTRSYPHCQSTSWRCPNPSWKNTTTAEKSSTWVWDSVGGREREVESVYFQIQPPVCARQRWVRLYQHHHTFHRHWRPPSNSTTSEAYTLCPPPVSGWPGLRDAQPGCCSAISKSMGQPYRAGEKDGDTRFCVDYRKLNSCTRKDVFLLPRIDDTLDLLSRSAYFTTLDLASGYIGKWEWMRGHERRWHLQPISAYRSSMWCHLDSVTHQRRFRDWWRQFWLGWHERSGWSTLTI